MGRKRIQQEYDWVAGTSSWTKTSEKRYLYDGVDLIQERDGANTITSVYTRAGRIGGLLSKTKRVTGQADAHYYYHYDGQANVVQMTDATQGVVADYKYDAWGNNRGLTGSQAGSNTFRFSTHEIHPLTGMYDCGFRFYDPGSGRFLNRDPIGEAGGLNFYAYAGNNPLSNCDPYGLSLWTFAKGFFFGFGAGFIVGAAFAIVAAAFPAIGAFITAYGMWMGAAGVALALGQAYAIMRSNLCPDEKHFQLGVLCGGIFGGVAGGKLAPKISPRNFPALPGRPPGTPSEPEIPESPPTPTKCFVAGTKILMADGSYKPIEQVKPGDWVMSRAEDDKNGAAPQKKQVKRLLINHAVITYILKVGGGEQIETTGSHRFYTVQKGWQVAKELRGGTEVASYAGSAIALQSAEKKSYVTPVVVYNFEVEDFHTYFVGETKLWVHNDRIVIYRGVPSTSPAFGQAQEGLAFPRAPYAHSVTPLDHNLGNTMSQFTSWTTDYDVAYQHATRNGQVPGVVIHDAIDDADAVPSPDMYNEKEVLLKGRRLGLPEEVTPPCD